MLDAYRKVCESVDFIKSKTSFQPRIGLVLGSGLGAFADTFKADATIKFSEIPHYSAPTVVGHGGKLVFGKIDDVPVVCQQGRVHFYEGHSMTAVAHPVRVLAKLGVKTVILTNAAGGMQDGMTPGDLMVIKDHLNLTGTSPLIGPNIDAFGPRFNDMTEAYSKRARVLLKDIYKAHGLRYCEGVYAGLTGPSFETPSEVQYLKKIGADAAGMSTVAETIALRHMGIEVVGISCITNLGAGLSPHTLSHEEVTQTGKSVEQKFTKLLVSLVTSL